MAALSLLLTVALQSGLPSSHELMAKSESCGFIFNVDGPGPAGDGIYIDRPKRTLLIERRPHEAAKRRCFVWWAEKRGFRVRYIAPRQ